MHWAVRQEFDRRAGARVAWGVGLSAVAAGLLLWLGYLLLAPYTVASSPSRDLECESPLAHGRSHTSPSLCAGERDWPELVGILALSVPTAVAGAALVVSGTSRRRTSAHVFAILEMQASEVRARGKK
ncbi:hypothetical protein K7395_14080 [Streptomyces filamentosus]|uniref:Integral membrane protein n=2 Tax=Streptomyces filamentosus TaxID=67294 RepID=A0ABY4UWP6_STRFL|nr:MULTISPECIES: hypothetical protein [Streptomyces]EFE76729.1 predicted protein [Streptomyces filamentosus NRRL 15998]ESU48792.1 hypothetical protein P376_3241 [Streptomyces sp. HCCB10043]EWS93699.1 hypothetical protein SSIG_04298 [Streptomyces filamentosus NRRL 11379]MYR80698.1 hypothetical protein [Streptomyces sp. SID5466]USC47795.1 hypothetical protein K7395_14080 [Streptomyces filamentosus]